MSIIFECVFAFTGEKARSKGAVIPTNNQIKLNQINQIKLNQINQIKLNLKKKLNLEIESCEKII